MKTNKLPNNWADDHIAQLQHGESVSFRPVGNSMIPLINDGDLVTISPYPVDPRSPHYGPKKDDIVLVKVRRFVYVHIIIMVHYDRPLQPPRYLIGNNHGRINGWVDRKAIYGVVSKVERKKDD